jgi:signal transduction histidine kinase
MNSTLDENAADETARLRRSMRDLVALSTVGMVWTGCDSERIGESLAELVRQTLALDFVYVRSPYPDEGGAIEAVSCIPERSEAQDARAIGEALEPWLVDPFDATRAIPDPLGQRNLQIAIARFGHGAAAGVLVAGSARLDFPTEQERLLLSVAANQAAIAIQRRRTEEERLSLIEREREAHHREHAARMVAEQAIRLRDEFLTTLSHELRTPLNSVFGWAQILRMTPDDPHIRAEAIEAIERGARAQVVLIDDLLDMSRIISGKLRLEVQTVELIPLIIAAIEAVTPAAEANDIAIEPILDPHAGPVRGDAARLQQVFWNLLSNAVKFTPRGGRVQVQLDRVNSRAEVCVSDTGRGIAADFLPHVFDRFRQADSSSTRRFGGMGLGLAIVRHLVEMHGGQVEATSGGEGKGATFKVQLPIAARVTSTQS